VVASPPSSEQGHAEQEHPPPSGEVGDPAHEQGEPGGAEREGGGDPLQVGEAEADVRADGGQGDVEDGEVDGEGEARGEQHGEGGALPGRWGESGHPGDAALVPAGQPHPRVPVTGRDRLGVAAGGRMSP
jgi:hypothetical protein